MVSVTRSIELQVCRNKDWKVKGFRLSLEGILEVRSMICPRSGGVHHRHMLMYIVFHVTIRLYFAVFLPSC